MKITITYCGKWNYLPRASSLGEKLEKKFLAEVELIKSSGGVYEIEVDGKKIFSKAETRRFPEDDEIFSAVSAC